MLLNSTRSKTSGNICAATNSRSPSSTTTTTSLIKPATHGTSLNEIQCASRQSPPERGRLSMIRAVGIREVLGAVPELRGLLVKYEQFFLAQVQQTAACNAVHDIHARMCRWLLRMHDLVGTDLPLTQEFLAQMMGV